MPLRRSCEIAEEIARRSPAAVESAAANPPATTRAITHPGRLAISGLASTMMSLSTVVISLPAQPYSAALVVNVLFLSL